MDSPVNLVFDCPPDIRLGSLEYVLKRANVGRDVEVELPDGLGVLVLSFIEGSQDAVAWREPYANPDLGVELIALSRPDRVASALSSYLEVLWIKKYPAQQRESELREVIGRIARYLQKPVPLPDWLVEPE